jgi:AraC-like DNA-binding protein
MKQTYRLIYLVAAFLAVCVFSSSAEKDRSFVVINASNGLADNSAQVVMCTKTGRLIISTIGNVNFYDGKTFTHVDTRHENEHPLPLYQGHYHLYFDNDYHIWLKDKQKVSCLNLMTEGYINNTDSVLKAMGFKGAQALDLFVDQLGTLWIVTERGLYSNRYDRDYVLSPGHNLQDVDVKDNMVYMFYENGEVIGADTLGNMVCRVSAYGEDDVQKYAGSSVLLPYGDGFFQIRNGDAGGILLYFDCQQRTFRKVMEQTYHLNNMVTDEARKKVYIPCEYGYWVYDTVNDECEHVPELRLSNGQTMGTDCNAMAFDHQGGMWIGTEKRGVLYARPYSVSFQSYPWSHELAIKYGMMMSEQDQNISRYHGIRANYTMTDSRGWTWTGTRKGVYIERPGDSQPLAYTRSDGLNNEVVHAIIEDYDHNIWVSTSCGISFFLVRDGKIVFVNNFTAEDNVPNESFENGKAILLPDSSIAMQAVEHVVVFRPKDLTVVNEPRLLNNIKPKLMKILVNGNEIVPGEAYDGNVIIDCAPTRVKHINLNSDQNSVSLTFSALNYFRPLQTYYRVRVPEFGGEWMQFSCHTTSMVDNRGLLHFPMANLAPGDYHVEVQASMFPDVWEENIPEDERFVWVVHVKQSWWRTTGMFFLLGLLLLGILMVNFYYYNRNTRMRARLSSEEGDIIRKICFYVERCEILSQQMIEPAPNEFTIEGASHRESSKLSSEFIELMLKIMPYVQANKHRTLTMRRLSEVGGMDVMQLYSVMKNDLYKSPRSLTRVVKLRKAAELLLTTDKEINEIAQECGFYTPNYFIGNFYHEYKQTPQQYRTHVSRANRG